jgi:RNA polymerase sigma factor for flagellar operon FliA
VHSDAAEKDLWRTLRTGDAGASDLLVARYRPWAEMLADRIHRRVAGMRIPREDLRQSASLGLLEAMSRFDPARGIPFAGYAISRVRGAVFNEVRQFSAGRVSAESAVSRERLQSLRGAQQADGGSPLDQLVDEIVGLGLAFLLDGEAVQVDAQLCTAQEYTERSLINTRLQWALQRLPERSRLLIQAHYFEHLPFKTLAERLGVSKGRVSQLHHAALLDLRHSLTPPPRRFD